MEIVVKDLSEVVIEPKARQWCKLPYPDHPKGCPNYGKRDTCPPKAEKFEKILNPPFYLVGVKFDLEAWANKLKEKHPNWSDRQARCCLYWQGKVRKVLKQACEHTNKFFHGKILYVPEGNGVDVFKTCEKVGIHLDRNPKKYVWKIAIIGKSSSLSTLNSYFTKQV
jgi:hypothetical protein